MSYIDTQDLGKYTIHAKDGKIGHFSEFYFDEDLFYLRYFVVDTEAFLLRNLVLVSPISLTHISSKEKLVEINITKKELEDSPKLESVDVISRQYEKTYNDHFYFPYYWGYGTSSWGIGPYGISGRFYDDVARSGHSVEEKSDLIQDVQSNNLRSSRELRSYSIKGKDDNEFGHIQGFILDSNTLSIDFVIIDTINFLPSKNVLLRPEWIEEIAWNSKTVKFPFSKEQIKSAPSYKKGELDENLIKKTDKHFASELTKHSEGDSGVNKDWIFFSVRNNRVNDQFI